MSNYMYPDMSGADPRPHDPRCAALCELPLIHARPTRGEYECEEGHIQHDDCTCDDLAALDADTAAEAWCDWGETMR